MRRYAWTIAVVIVFAAILFGSTIITLYTDWLWFKDLGFNIVFSKTILTQVQMGLVFGLAFFVIVYANLWLARYIAPPPTMRYTLEDRLTEKFGRMAKGILGILLFLGTLIVAGMVGLEATVHWDEYLRYTNATSFASADPVFNRDIGFYIFQLSFLKYLYGWLFFTFFAAALATAALHYADEKIEFIMNVPQFAPRVKAHVSILVAALFFIKAWGYYLNRYDLMNNPGDLFYGAGYTDIHARLPMLYVLMAVSILGGLLILFNITRRGVGLAVLALALVVGASFILGSLYPNAIQQFVVKPNEFNKEQPYIRNAIKYTRNAYNIDKVNERQYKVSDKLDPAAVSANQATIQNVRLWDYLPLRTAYGQLQAIQQYYTFEDVDVDRYTVNGRFRQVMLSARELAQDQLNPNAQTWVNKRLVYTHGYGIVMSPVSEVSQEGLPTLYIKDIPPIESVDIKIQRPEVYFGEKTDEHVFVDTATKEFDYPSGDEAITTVYRGKGGVRVGSFFRRLLFSLRFSDVNLLLNSDVRPTSRVLFRRNIRERAKTLLPFLVFDGDPYLVVSGGRLYWLHDAYTSADKYPYSEMTERPLDGYQKRLNYIRNSVKVVTDAYTGDVRAYVFDEDDPIIRTYSRIFPGILRPRSELQPDLLAHIRYPEDLFSIQADIYATYHMTSPQVFYSRGDLWTIPNIPETTGTTSGGLSGERVRMEPNYLIMRLPGEQKEQMIILTSFTRANKDNMVAWLCAKNDPEDFGRLVLYEFPKGELIYGPAQIAARVNQDARISQQLALWNQQGTNVLRGSLLAIPIEGTIMYVEPLYLQATGARIPELKRVIVAIGNKIAMEETFSDALSQVVGSRVAQPASTAAAPTAAAPAAAAPAAATPSTPAGPAPAVSQPASPDVQRLVRQANEQFEEAERRQKAGDWAGYGQQIQELQRTLRRLNEAVQGQ